MADLKRDVQGFMAAGGFDVNEVSAEVPGLALLTCFALASGQGPDVWQIWVDERPRIRSDALTPDQRAERSAWEHDVISVMAAHVSRAGPTTRHYFLCASLVGYSAEFMPAATHALTSDGRIGGVRVPVQFFDADYRQDARAGTRTKTVLKRVLDAASARRRVAQPFVLRRALDLEPASHDPGDGAATGDVVEHLEGQLLDPPARPTLRFIDGPAGSGKSVAFEALVSAAYQEFIEAKQKRISRMRPIVFLPDHLRGANVGYVDDLVRAVVDTDMAAPVRFEQLQWLLMRGYATWMFDGLDEFYEGSYDFFDFLHRVLTAPGSQAQILISTRDSLLTSNPALRRFLERHLPGGGTDTRSGARPPVYGFSEAGAGAGSAGSQFPGHGMTGDHHDADAAEAQMDLAIFELQPWGPAAWRQVAWLELEQGREGAQHSSRVDGFCQALENSPTLASLAALPFYCTELLHLAQSGEAGPADDIDLLDAMVASMLAREHGKDVFDWDDFIDLEEAASQIAAERRHGTPWAVDLARDADNEGALRAALSEPLAQLGRANLLELLGAMAHFAVRTPPQTPNETALSVDVVRDYFAAGFVSSDLAPRDVDRIATVLVQFAFLGAGKAGGGLDFSQPIVAEYLAARYALQLLNAQAETPNPQAQGRPPLHNATRAVTALTSAVGTVPVTAGSLFQRAVTKGVFENQNLARWLAIVGQTPSIVQQLPAHVRRGLVAILEGQHAGS
ncbi:MAG: hypothetical protein AAFO79_01125 [Pseudomonadota bacterium]